MHKIIGRLLALSPFAATQSVANVAGVWELNKTAPQSSGALLDNFKIRIDQQGTQFSVTQRATERCNLQQESIHVVIGQETRNEMHGAPAPSRAQWDGATFVSETTVNFAGKALRMTGRYEIGADGNTLTFREHSQFGDEPAREQVVIFNRQPAPSWEPDALLNSRKRYIRIYR